MKKTLEKLWNEYLLDENAVIDTDEERELIKITSELHDKATALLNKEQKAAVSRYVDALCEIDALCAKKAFFAGCKFTFSFLSEAGNFNL